MAHASIAPLLLAGLIVPAAPAQTAKQTSKRDATSDSDAPIEIVVETKKRPDWLFPGLDHPRVQAFFRSGSSTGASLFDEPTEPQVRPLVRAGTVTVRGADERADRKAARRFARQLVADVRPALEACYTDALGREPIDAARLTFQVELRGGDRSAIRVSAGTLGDVYGNSCVHGVLEFADVEAPAVDAAIEIPVWFWLQTQ